MKVDFIIVHELVHIIHYKHGKAFIAYMDTYLLYYWHWRETKNKLNALTLDYII
ncbi:MAG: M48 family metallopeptidase [Endomicrobium sp.]|nr:M48 family metallopeptidase [Endomicrobium sp.]